MTDIKINETDWTALSQEDKDKIVNILNNSFKHQHSIVADKAVDPATKAKGIAPDLTASFANPWCTAGCIAAEGIAVAACGALTGPAVGICIAAAHAAASLCRSRC